MSNPRTDLPETSSRLTVFVATGWLVLFLGAFFNVEITDPSISRWQLWSLVPELLDFIDPPAEVAGRAGGAPRIHSGWEYFPQRIDLLGVAAVILAGAWGTGCLILRVLRPPVSAARLEHTVFAFALGLAAFSLATLGAGLAGALSRPLLGSLVLLPLFAEVALRLLPHLRSRQGDKETRRQGENIGADPSQAPSFSLSPPLPVSMSSSTPPLAATASPLHTGHWILLATLAPFLLATLLGACLPSTDFDVNEYHFQGPKEFYQAGRISFLAHNVYTSFPFGTEMLTLLAMVLEGDWYRGALAGKTVLMCFGPLTGLALFAAGRRWFGTTAGLLAAVLYLSTPWIYRISTIAYAEGGLCFYLLASLLALMIAAAPDVPTPSLTLPLVRQFLLVGLLAGSAMACKYPALVSVVGPVLVVAVCLAVRPPGRARWVLPATFLVGTLVTIGPWLAKNVAETGNPVYPLAYSLFGGRDWDVVLDARWKNAHSPSSYSLASLVGMAIEVAARSKWNSPLLFAFAPLALVAAPTRRRALWVWLYVGWLFVSCWLFTHRIDRFWVPLIPVVALLAGAGGAWFWKSLKPGLTGRMSAEPAGSFGPSWKSRFDRFFGVCLVVIPCFASGLFNLEVIVSGLSGYNDYLRDLDEAALTAEQVTSPEILWLNRTLPRDRPTKVLSVGDAEMFYTRLPVAYNTVFDHSLIEEWCSPGPGEAVGAGGLKDAAAIRQKFADEGITHVYVNWLEILRYRSPGNYGYTNFVTPELFAELERLGLIGPAAEMPLAAMPLERLDESRRGEAQSWGKALITRSADGPAFTTYQVFPVVREGGTQDATGKDL